MTGSERGNLLITGASGFVGRGIIRALMHDGRYSMRAAVRGNTVAAVPPGVAISVVDDVGAETDWRDALAGINCVIHTVARVHSVQDRGAECLADYRRINVSGTKRLAEQAAAAGVRRLVFLSSIKVNGEATAAAPFSAHDTPAPQDAYALSKWEAEQALHEIAARTGMEVVIVRPPLVYGPHVKANFDALIRMVRRGVPLPLGAINNRRSLVALDNLVDLLISCVSHPAASGKTFLVSDNEDVSTPELIRRLSCAMGKQVILFPVPLALLRLAGRLIGRAAAIERLTGSLQVDIRHTRDTLNWNPPISLDEGLARAVSDVHA